MEKRVVFRLLIALELCLLLPVCTAQIIRNMRTVLSIDGGGIRGIIPGTILGNLETKLQDDNLTGNTTSMDLATVENMRALEQIGLDLLTKPESRVNLRTGNMEPVPGGGTNDQALERLATKLSDERKFRKFAIQQRPSQ